MGFLSHRSCCQHLWTHRVAGDRMNMVSGCGLMVEHLEIKRTRFDSLKASPIFLVVCAKRRRQQAVNLLHWKHRGFESLNEHFCRCSQVARRLSHNEVIAGSIPAIGTIPPWCSGSTTDFGSVSPGSTPGGGSEMNPVRHK